VKNSVVPEVTNASPSTVLSLNTTVSVASNFQEPLQDQGNSEKDETLIEPPPNNIPQNQINELTAMDKYESEPKVKTEAPVLKPEPVELPEESKPDDKVENLQVYPHMENHMNDEETIETQSAFLSYFVAFTVLCIISYICWHNKKKIIALILEGRRRNPSGRGGRRSSSAQYRKLDNNLEEAMADNSDDNLRHVIY